MFDDIPSAAEFNAARVTNPNQSEVIRQRLYDSQIYPAAGTQQLAFFSAAPGSGFTSALGSTAGTAKTQFDTNQELNSQLPSGKAYLAESIEVLFVPGSVATANTYTPANLSLFAVAAAATLLAQASDINTFYQSGMLEFNILSKNYLREQPLMSFPPKAHIDLSVGVATNSATVGEVGAVLAKAVGRPYYLTPKVALQPAMNFEVLLRWPGVVAMPSTFNGRVTVYIDGFLQRASQ